MKIAACTDGGIRNVTTSMVRYRWLFVHTIAHGNIKNDIVSRVRPE